MSKMCLYAFVVKINTQVFFSICLSGFILFFSQRDETVEVLGQQALLAVLLPNCYSAGCFLPVAITAVYSAPICHII